MALAFNFSSPPQRPMTSDFEAFMDLTFDFCLFCVGIHFFIPTTMANDLQLLSFHE